MPTLSQAENKDDWVFHAKVVSKGAFVYTRRNSTTQEDVLKHIYSIIMVDVDGKSIELKTDREKKIYTVDRKVKQDCLYQVTGKKPFAKPNAKFSSANFELWNSWFITPVGQDTKFKTRSSLPCSNDIVQTKKNLEKNGKPENILAKCIGRPIKGPIKFISNKPLVRGWYMKLCDAFGKEFYALVWHQHAILKRTGCPLFDCHKNQPILLIAARTSHTDSSKYTGEEDYTLITNTPPVLDSQSISKAKITELNKIKQEMVLRVEL